MEKGSISIYTNSLKLARKNKKLTQKQVEEVLGLRALTMKDYETGRLKLPVDTAMKLAELYDTDLNVLLGFENKEYEPKMSEALPLFFSTGMIQSSNLSRLIFEDEVIRSVIDQKKMIDVEDTLFSLLTESMNQKQKQEFVLELVRFLNSLIGIDGKIEEKEVNFRDFLLESTHLKIGKYELLNLRKYFYQAYLPTNVPSVLEEPALKHFLIWILYIVSSVDHEINYKEENYIEDIAERVKLSKFNLKSIRRKIDQYLKRNKK